MDAAVARESASVLPDDYDLQLAFLGDDGVGKSSLLSAYVTHRFPPDGTVARVLDPQLLRRTVAPVAGQSGMAEALRSANLKLLDTDGTALGRDAGALAAYLRQVRPDAIVLCYSSSSPASLVRVVQYWLPSIVAAAAAKPFWPYIPVCVTATQVDAFDEDNVAGWRDAYAAICKLLAPITRLQTAASASPAAGAGAGAGIGADGSPNPARKLAPELVSPGAASGVSVPASASVASVSQEDLGAVFLHGVTAESEAARYVRAAITYLMTAYPCVIGQSDVSALDPAPELGIVGEIADLLNTSMCMVMHPTFPVFDTALGHLTPAMEMACARIFTVLDRDGDGRLSAAEMQLQQYLTHRIRVTEGEMLNTLKVMKGDAHALDEAIVVTDDRGGDALTYAGFRHMFHNFVLQSYTKELWKSLHAFGYRLTRPTADADAGLLPLVRPPTFHSTAPGGSPAGAAAASTPASASSEPIYTLALYTPPHFLDATLPRDDALWTIGCPSTAGGRFLRDLFHLHAEAADPLLSTEKVLSHDAITALFATTPTGTHPFGPMFPDCTLHNSFLAFNMTAWMNLWRMVLATEPAAAFRALYELGFAAAAPGGTLSLDPRGAAIVDGFRKVGRNVKTAVRRVFVLGSKGAGKTTTLLHFLHGGAPGVREHADRIAGGATSTAAGGLGASMAAGPAPTSKATHYVSPVPPAASSARGADAEGGAQAAAPSAREAALPDTLVFTEWPAEQVSDAMSIASSSCDAVLFVVDPSHASSIEYFRRAVEQVPDGVGVAVVAQVRSAATLAATSSGDAAGAAATSDRTGSGGGGNREGLDALASICSAAPAVTIPKAYSLTGDTADETTVGLSLELFRMRLTSPPHASEELARYLAHIAVDCTANEPQTQTRRSAVVWARRQRQLLVAGTVVALAGVAVAAYTYHRGTRTTVDSLIARARSAVSGWFSRGSVAGAAAGGGSQRK